MIEGKQIIGFENLASGVDTFQSVNPASGERLEYSFFKATKQETDLAAKKAASAFQVYRKKSGIEKAFFLETIAEELLLIGDELITVCCTETALPKGRIEGERMRTVNQLKMFAALLKEGSWLDARIETAMPDRVPLAKPDIRFMQIALGPVVVFGASNFPLAFSVAGGDTASALAAGCPVIVKAHSAHPATSALVGKAIQTAAKKTNMPDGVFSLVFGDGKDVGIQLVVHPEVKAVGFTGSFIGGKALYDAAVSRENPIPVYAEMGSTNPVFILPEALKERGDAIAAGFSGSVTLGVGQFCTNPGMLIYEKETTNFSEKIKAEFTKTSGGVMLAENIFKSYQSGIIKHNSITGVDEIAAGNKTEGSNNAQPVLFKTSGTVLKENPDLGEEIFGPTSVLVEAISKDELLDIAKNLSGHLTATVHGTENDLMANKDLLDVLEQKVGRVVINGFPTGVEVCSAMVHGGPFPATTDSRSTSVGTAAIFRFTRAISYQSMPQSLLPIELQNKNELGIFRIVNGERTNGKIEN
jgi:2,5-dioxopentanoate dehydrogenase